MPTQHAELLQVGRDAFTSLAESGYPEVAAYRTTKVVLGQPRTVLVTYNENLFVAQLKTLLREIATRMRKLGEVRERLDRRRRGAVRSGRAPTLAGTRSAVNAILKGRHMKDLFEVKLTLQNELPVLEYELRQDAWDLLQRTLLGKTILFTDNHDWSDGEIVHAYRAQHHIEDAFRDMKDPDHIAMRPQFHWTDQKVQVHVFTCVLALMLLSLQRRELAAKGFPLSNRRMIELLGSIREVVTVFPPAEGESGPQLRTTLSAMSAEQRALFDALDLGRYTAA